MATCTLLEDKADTGNVAAYTSDAFTPTANDLLVLLTHCVATLPVPTITDTQNLGWTNAAVCTRAGSSTSGGIWVANTLAAASSMTVTVTYGADAGTGNSLAIYGVAGMTRTGSNGAIKQGANQNNQAAGATPAPSFAAAVDTNNPTLGAVWSAANPPAVTPPTSWTEGDDIGHATPTAGIESVFRNSGFTGQTITWGSTSAAAFCDAIVELDTTSPPAGGADPFPYVAAGYYPTEG